MTLPTTTHTSTRHKTYLLTQEFWCCHLGMGTALVADSQTPTELAMGATNQEKCPRIFSKSHCSRTENEKDLRS